MENLKPKRGNFFKTLEFALTLIIILLSVIPIIFAGQIITRQTSEFLLKTEKKELEQTNEILSQSVKTALGEKENITAHLADELSLAQTLDEKKDILSHAKDFSGLKANLYDLSGKIILSSPTNNTQSINYEPNARLIQDAIETGKLNHEFVSNPQGKALFIHNIPILNSNGKVTGVLSGIFNADFLNLVAQHFSAGKLFPNQEIFIVNSEGKVIIASENFVAPGQIQAGLPPVANVISGRKIVLEYDASDKQWVASAMPIEDYNLGIVIQIPKNDVLALIDSIRSSSLRLTLIIIFITIVVALIISYLISRPLKNLAKGAARIANGDYDFKLEVPAVSNEMEMLVSSFETMRQKIKDNIEELILAKSKDEAILKSIGDAVLVTDLQKKIIFFNEAAEKASGFSEEEAYNQNADIVVKFIEEKEPHGAIDIIGKVLSHEQSVRMPEGVLLICKDGTKIAVTDSASPVRDSQNNMIGCILVFRDTTKEREAQKVKDEFISIVSHELKTPVTAVNGFLDMFMDGNYGKITKEGKELLDYAREGNSKLLSLVNDLLNVSRIESGKLTYEVKAINLEEQLNFVLKQLQSIAKEKELILSWDKPKGKLPMVLADPDRVTQVLDNLIGNALKFTPRGSVTIKTKKEDNFIKISVRDTGPGIPRDLQKQIFQKFYRAGVKVTGGTGLGLYISKQIVEKMGGKIGFESEEEKGSEFYFTLPIAK